MLKSFSLLFIFLLQIFGFKPLISNSATQYNPLIYLNFLVYYLHTTV